MAVGSCYSSQSKKKHDHLNCCGENSSPSVHVLEMGSTDIIPQLENMRLQENNFQGLINSVTKISQETHKIMLSGSYKSQMNIKKSLDCIDLLYRYFSSIEKELIDPKIPEGKYSYKSQQIRTIEIDFSFQFHSFYYFLIGITPQIENIFETENVSSWKNVLQNNLRQMPNIDCILSDEVLAYDIMELYFPEDEAENVYEEIAIEPELPTRQETLERDMDPTIKQRLKTMNPVDIKNYFLNILEIFLSKDILDEEAVKSLFHASCLFCFTREVFCDANSEKDKKKFL